MTNKPVFAILCVLQMLVGFVMFVFGMIDRIGIQMMISFLMLPIWNGILIGLAGFSGLLIGRSNKRQGFAGSESASALRAINTVCIGLSFLIFYQYGTVLSYIGYRIEMKYTSELYFATPVPVPPKQQSPIDGTNDDDTRQGIFSIIMIFSLVEMFLGCWLAMFEKGKMVIGSSQGQDQVPLIIGEPTQGQYVQQNQFSQQTPGTIIVPSPQVQQQQQPVYMVSGNTPMPVRAVVAPTNQQQPSYVALQPSGAMATRQPQPQPQYVVMQNPGPSAAPVPQGSQYVVMQNPPPGATAPEPQGDPAIDHAKMQPNQHVQQQQQQQGQYDVRTDSPAPQTPADIRLVETNKLV